MQLPLVSRRTLFNLLLPTEWEILLLAALNVLGTLPHEPDLGGRTRPDIVFDDGDRLRFAADVTSLSDDDSINRAFLKRLVKANQELADSGVVGAISAHLGVVVERSIRRLSLPPEQDLVPKVFDGGFRQF